MNRKVIIKNDIGEDGSGEQGNRRRSEDKINLVLKLEAKSCE